MQLNFDIGRIESEFCCHNFFAQSYPLIVHIDNWIELGNQTTLIKTVLVWYIGLHLVSHKHQHC